MALLCGSQCSARSFVTEPSLVSITRRTADRRIRERDGVTPTNYPGPLHESAHADAGKLADAQHLETIVDSYGAENSRVTRQVGLRQCGHDTAIHRKRYSYKGIPDAEFLLQPGIFYESNAIHSRFDDEIRTEPANVKAAVGIQLLKSVQGRRREQVNRRGVMQ